MSRQPSLRRRLLLAGGVGLLLVSLLASALLGELFKRSARDRLDHELQQDMLTLVAQMEVTPDNQLQLRQEPNDARFQRVFSGAYWQIAGADGRVLLQSRSLWDETLPATATGPATRNLTGPLQQSLRARVQQVRLPRASEPFVAVVATDRSALDADVAAFRQRTAIALGVLVAAWLAALASQVHFGLARCIASVHSWNGCGAVMRSASRRAVWARRSHLWVKNSTHCWTTSNAWSRARAPVHRIWRMR